MTYRDLGFVVVGGMLVGTAGLVSNSMIERALLSDPARTLSWGPALFRALLAWHGLWLALAGIVCGRSSHVAEGAVCSGLTTIEKGFRHTSRYTWLMLAGLSVLAVGLRLWHLNSDLWIDEVFTLLDFARPPLGEIVTSFPAKNQHMLYSLLAHVSIGLLGESAWALRLPAVLFGMGSLWALFLLGHRIVGTRQALLACALMTGSYHHIWFSQNARGYTGLLFFATLATWLWIKASSRAAWRWWIWYAIVVSLGMLSHLTMVFVVASHALVYLVSLARIPWSDEPNARRLVERRSRWQPMIGWALCSSVTLQLYALSLPEFMRTALHEGLAQSAWTDPVWAISELLRSLQIGFSGVAVVLGGGVLAGLGWMSICHRDWRVGASLVLPGLLAVFTMLILGHTLRPRFLFFSMGFALLIGVHGTMTVPSLLFAKMVPRQPQKRWGQGLGLVLTCLLIIASGLSVPRGYALPKQDFSGARDYVEQHRKPGDAAVAVGVAGTIYGRFFAPHWSTAQTRGELNVIRRSHSRVWLIYTLPIEIQAFHPGIWSVIEKYFEVVKVFPGTLGDGELYVCRQRSGREAAYAIR